MRHRLIELTSVATIGVLGWVSGCAESTTNSEDGSGSGMTTGSGGSSSSSSTSSTSGSSGASSGATSGSGGTTGAGGGASSGQGGTGGGGATTGSGGNTSGAGGDSTAGSGGAGGAGMADGGGGGTDNGGGGDLGAGGAAGSQAVGLGGAGGEANGAAGEGGASSGDLNLFQGASFETGTEGWYGRGAASVSQSATMAHTGSYSLLTTGRTGSWNGPEYDVLGIVTPGIAYTVTVWVRLADGSPNSDLILSREYTGSGCGESRWAWVHSAGAQDPGAWVEITGTLQIDAACVPTTLVLYVEGPADGVDYFIDDVSLVEQ